MNKKRQLPLKWTLALLIFLVPVVLVPPLVVKNFHLPAASDLASARHFFEYLESLLGIRNPNDNNSLNPSFNDGRFSNKTSTNSLSNTEAGLNAKSSPGKNPSEDLGANAAQGAIHQENSGGDNQTDTITNQEEINISDINGTSNAVMNVETNTETNSDTTMDKSAVNGADNNPSNNPSNNADNNSGDNSGNIISTRGDTQGGYSGGSTAEGFSGNGGNNSSYTLPGNLPTINPIPSDDTVSQSVAVQNQQNDSLSNLVASRQALVVPVQEQAQAMKYQTITANDIPAVSQDQPPADVQKKIRLKQLTFH